MYRRYTYRINNNFSGYDLPKASSKAAEVNPFKYGGKEFEERQGVNIYDFNARTYAADIARFMQPDPLATENHGVSPYIYCNGDPINFIDPTGEKVYFVNGTRRIISEEEAGSYNSLNMKEINAQYEGRDVVIIIDKDGKIIDTSKTFTEGTINGTFSFPADLPFCGSFEAIFTLFNVNGDDNAKSIFEFLSDNIMKTTGIEFGLNLMGESADGSANDVFTGHTANKLSYSSYLFAFRNMMNSMFRDFIHSHKKNIVPSEADHDNALAIFNILGRSQYIVPAFEIYVATKKQYRPYNPYTPYLSASTKKIVFQ